MEIAQPCSIDLEIIPMRSASLKTYFVLFVAAAAMAPFIAYADTGFYIGGSAGGATLEADVNDISIPSLPSSIDEDDTAIKVFAGYNFDLPLIDLGVEAGYVDFGEPEIPTALGTILIETTGINVWGIAALDAGPVQVFGKLGMVSWDVDADLLDASASDDGTDLGYGLGLRFGLGPVRIRGEYELYDIDDADIAMLSVGVSYQFN